LNRVTKSIGESVGKVQGLITCFLLIIIGSSVSILIESYQMLDVQTTTGFVVSDSSEPPTIEDYPISENDTVTGLQIDAIYSGQTEQVFSFHAAVNDSDGVDSVMFRYHVSGEWQNQKAMRTSGTVIDGIYTGNITFSIEWNPVKQLPEPRSIEFSFKIFANDTLGNWVETIPIPYSYFYWQIMTPTNQPNNDVLLIIGASFVAAIVVIAIYMKRRHMNSVGVV